MVRCSLRPLVTGGVTALTAVIGVLVGLSHADPCPEARFDLTGCSFFTSMAAQLDTSCLQLPYGFGGRAHLDWPAGQLSVDSYIGDNGGGSIIAEDDFMIVGPPGGPIGLTASLHFVGSGFGNLLGGKICGGASIGAAIASGGARDTSGATVGCHDPPLSLDRMLTIGVTHAPGETFRLRLSLYASASFGSADAGGVLDFDGLPAGYSLVSCHGFSAESTPARPGTWGRLKTRYR